MFRGTELTLAEEQCQRRERGQGRAERNWRPSVGEEADHLVISSSVGRERTWCGSVDLPLAVGESCLLSDPVSSHCRTETLYTHSLTRTHSHILTHTHTHTNTYIHTHSFTHICIITHTNIVVKCLHLAHSCNSHLKYGERQ